ncbi:MAG TPA: MarR family transcriptional regulator [Candidatus Acidoferrum sp.]|nr:MarR family transcriptional regulator [Candidatus Acidoferrum sp.]
MMRVKHKNDVAAPEPSNAAAAFDAPILELADHLHSAAIHLLRRLRVRDRESGIGPAQLSALSVLVFGGPRSLSELAEAEQVRLPTMSRIVSGLQRAGLVRRRPTKDKRRLRLEATSKGTHILWKGRERRVQSLANALESLPESESRQLAAAVPLLQQIIRKL